MTLESSVERSHVPGPISEPAYVFLPNKKGTIRAWIGIQGYTLDDEMKSFVWLLNQQNDQDLLRQPEHRLRLAERIAQLKHEGIDAIIGPAIDFRRSNKRTRETFTIPNSTAIYIDEANRLDFTANNFPILDKRWHAAVNISPKLIERALALVPKAKP